MAAHPLRALRLNARELLREPGRSATVDARVAPSELGIDDGRVTGEVEVDLTAVSGIDGIVVAGSLCWPWSAPCRRCLADVRGVSRVEVREVYQDGPSDEDVFEIEGDQIDLAPAVREHVLLDMPEDPLCRPDCAGICPMCGTDRNLGSCDCDTTVHDERWAALDDLRLDD